MTVAESPVLARRLAVAGVTWRGVLFGAAVPFLFLHVSYQPGVHVPLGSTRVGIEASDVAVLALGIAAFVDALRREFRPLLAAAPAWTIAAALLAWIWIRTLFPFHLVHAVTAAKFAEYALLALAAPLLLRRRGDFAATLAAVVVWGAAATVVGLVQFFGADVAGAWPTGRRQPSFLGHNDFAAFEGMVLAVGAASLMLEPFLGRAAAGAAVLVAVLGLLLAGATAGAVGVVAAVLVLAAAAWRRGRLRAAPFAVSAAAAGVVVLGVLAIRGSDYTQFLRFLGVEKQERSTRTQVQTYAHHTLLAYIGWEIYRRHPVAGAGWQRSNDPDVYKPVEPAAARRFPDVSPLSFPDPTRPYGLQNAYVEAAADLGTIGLLLWLAFLAVPIVVGARVAARAPPYGAAVAALGVAWLVVTVVLWIPQNLVAGLPLDALMWLGIGAVATGAAARG